MITIANPIYDTVFKRLMENREVAKALVEPELKDAPEWVQQMIRVLQNAAAEEAVRVQMAVEDEATSLLQRSEKMSLELEEERRQKEAALSRFEEERRQKEEERRQKEDALARIAELERQLRA